MTASSSIALSRLAAASLWAPVWTIDISLFFSYFLSCAAFWLIRLRIKVFFFFTVFLCLLSSFQVTPRFSRILHNVHVKTNLLAYAVKVEMVLSKVISAWHVFFLEVALQHCQKIGLWGFQVVCHYFKVLLLALPSFFVCDKILVSVSSKSTISIDEVCPDVFQLSPKFIGFFFCQKLYISKNIEKKIFLSIKRHLSQCRDYLQWLSNERRSY